MKDYKKKVSYTKNIHGNIKRKGIYFKMSEKNAIQSEKPNILIIMCDQLRSSALGCYGNSVVRTPWMDSLAEGGVVFDRAYTQNPVCAPARNGLVAGLNPCRMNLWENLNQMIPVTHPFPELLGRAGYATCSIGKMHFSPARAPHGFQKRFVSEEVPDYYEDDDYLQFLDAHGYGDIDEPHGHRNAQYYVPQVSLLPPELHTTGWTGAKSCEYIRKNKNRPFCLFTSFIKPHPPFDPAERYLKQYQDVEMDACLEGEELTGLDLSIWVQNGYKMGGTEELTAEKLNEIRRYYYASVTQIDDQIGNIIMELKRAGIYDNTLIIFTADHGEMLGDHQCVGKRCFYESSARIPMILSWPNHFQGGQRRKQLVSLEDIYATVLSAGQAEIPEETEGVSLLSACVEEDAKTHRYLFGGNGDGPIRKYFLLSEEWKYIYFVNGGQEALFHRENDPLEQHNVAADNPEVCKQLRKVYIEWVQKHQIEGILVDGDFPKNPKAELFNVGFLNQSPSWRETKV